MRRGSFLAHFWRSPTASGRATRQLPTPASYRACMLNPSDQITRCFALPSIKRGVHAESVNIDNMYGATGC